MLVALVISSITCAADELTPPPWPDGMTAQRQVDGAVLLNKVAADATHAHLEFADRLPELARESCRSQLAVEQTKAVEGHSIDVAQCAAEKAPLEANQMTTVERAKWFGLGAAAVIVILEGWRIATGRGP